MYGTRRSPVGALAHSFFNMPHFGLRQHSRDFGSFVGVGLGVFRVCLGYFFPWYIASAAGGYE